MAQNLKEFLATNKCKGFRSVPHYVPDGDFLTYYLRDERCYSQRVDDLLTVYLSCDDDALVGCKIKGVKHLLDTAGAFGVHIDDGTVRLGFLFFVGAAMAKNEEQKKRYAELREAAKDASFNRREVQPDLQPA